ncbi:hypothetical protein BDW62DRAFT_71606 [Aspergillus aurantiobrunneus]
MPIKVAILPPQSDLSHPLLSHRTLCLFCFFFSLLIFILYFDCFPQVLPRLVLLETPSRLSRAKNHDALSLTTSTLDFLISICFSVFDSLPACQTVVSAFAPFLLDYCLTHLYTFLHAIRLILRHRRAASRSSISILGLFLSFSLVLLYFPRGPHGSHPVSLPTL